MALHDWISAKLDDDDEALRKAKALLIKDVAISDALRDDVDSLIAVARILALDAREAFLVLGTTNQGLRVPLSSWTEQKAVKLLRQMCEVLGPLADAATHAITEWTTRLLPPATAVADTTHVSESIFDLVGVDALQRNVAVVTDPSGEGNGSLVLVRPVAAFTPVVSVPGKALFNLDTVRRYSSLGGVLHRSQWRKMLDDEGEAILLACLVYERGLGASSHWAALLETFPASFPYVPTNWSDEEMQLLSGTSIVDEVAAKQSSMTSFAETLAQVLARVAAVHTPVFDTVFVATAISETLALSEKVSAVFNRDALQWARCIVDSRAFHLNYKANGSTDRVLLTLAPLADMINHTSQGTHILTRRIDADGQFVLEAGAALGEEMLSREIMMSYGPLQTWELLLSYGFVPDAENENDRLPFANLSDLIALQPPAEGDEVDEYTEHFEAWKRRIIDAHALNVVDALYIPNSGVAPPVVRAILRLCQAEADDFPALEANPFAAGPAYLEKRVSETLANFASSFLDSVDPEDDDEATGATAGGDGADTVVATTRRRMASRVRGSLLRIAERLYGQEANDSDDDGNDDTCGDGLE